MTKEVALGLVRTWQGAGVCVRTHLVQFIAGRQDDGRQQQVEEHLVVKTDGIPHGCYCCQAEDETNDHS